MGAGRRPWRPFLSFLVILAMTACGGAGRYPLLSPIAQAGSHGYSEEPLGGDRYIVTFVGPSRLSASAPAARDRDAQGARQEALDLAIWRAAQIAQSAGAAGFRVVNQSSTVDVAAQPTYYDQQFYGPFGSNVGAGGIVRPPSVGASAPMNYPESPTSRLQGRASVDIVLVRNLGPDDLVAADVIGQLRIKYPDAERT